MSKKCLVLLACVWACSSKSNSSEPAPTAAPEPVAPAGASSAPAPTQDARTNPSDASVVVDAGADGVAADASRRDAGRDSGGLANGPTVFYAALGPDLATIAPDTAAHKLVRVMESRSPMLAWDPVADELRAIVNPLTAPEIGNIHRCTGLFSAGHRITKNGQNVLRAKMLAYRASTSTFYTAIDADGDFNTETLVTVDVSTGAINVVGEFGPAPADVEAGTFVGDDLYVIDSDGGQTKLYTVNLTNARTQLVGTFSKEANVLAYDEGRALLASWTPTDENLVSVDKANAQLTSIAGVAYAPGTSFRVIRSLVAAPSVTNCP